ncbi:S41 family peptidase [bacterium]|jgi:carboxyl-terminal processing protease|nr:S41 family peptidase [bacterium]MBT4649038.1 S41 family peptidase [bacterium]
MSEIDFEHKNQFSTEGAHEKKKKSWLKRLTHVYAFFFLILLGFIAGLVTNGVSQRNAETNVIEATAEEIVSIFSNLENADPAMFDEAWKVLHTYYLKRSQISETDLFYGAVAGMVNAIDDPYTMFFEPEIAAEFTRELNGTFFGIGAEIGRKDGNLVIIAPLPNTPAEKAGLQAGDRIYAVDGVDTSLFSVDQVVNVIRGDKGKEVILTVVSKNETTPKDISIIRDKIEIPSVVYKLEEGIAIIEISHFNGDTDSRFTKVAQQVLRDNPKGIILDLRNNPGGFLDVSVDIAGSWLDPGQIVLREIFSDQRDNRDYKTGKEVDLSGFETVILVNGGSASASEILAGALQDYNKVQLVGETTFGKGSVQQLFELEDGSAIKLTVANWLTPNGRAINEQGIEPDIIVEYAIEDYENNLDPQLDKARELILE